MVQKYGVDCFTHRIIAAEAERHITHSAGHLCARQILLDPARSVDKVHRIVVVLFNARGDGKNVGVENNVFRCEVQLIDQDAVCTFTNLDFSRIGVGLTLFIKRHDNRRCTITLDESGLLFELRQPFFHGDGIYDALALNASQASLNHAPF